MDSHTAKSLEYDRLRDEEWDSLGRNQLWNHLAEHCLIGEMTFHFFERNPRAMYELGLKLELEWGPGGFEYDDISRNQLVDYMREYRRKELQPPLTEDQRFGRRLKWELHKALVDARCVYPKNDADARGLARGLAFVYMRSLARRMSEG